MDACFWYIKNFHKSYYTIKSKSEVDATDGSCIYPVAYRGQSVLMYALWVNYIFLVGIFSVSL